MDADLQQRFESHACACEQQLRVQYCWRILPLNVTMRHGLPLTQVAGGALELPGVQLARHVRGAQAVVLAAVTLGFDCQRMLDQLGSVNAVDQLLRSTCASSLVEAGLDAVRDQLNQLLQPAGLHVGPPFAPGYGDLPLDVQPAFLDVLGARKSIGLCVTQGNMLLPEKSVTVCLGVFSQSVVPPDERTKAIPCHNCTNKDSCELKKKGRTCYE